MSVGWVEQAAVLADALDPPGLVVVAGPRGAGKTKLVRAAGVPLLAARALAPLQHRDGLPLARAVRAPMPADDVALAAEAVRVRLGDRALLVDDVQHADAFTLAVVATIAAVAPVVVTLRTPSPITDRLRALSRLWLDLPASPAADPVAAAGVLAGLPVDARTALAALGQRGRPGPAALLGPGAGALLAAGLAEQEPDGIAPSPAYLAEVAAGLLAPAERRTLHARLGAELPDGVEAARHLMAAGAPAAAAARAQAAAEAAATTRERAAALLVAASADAALALPAAAACEAAGLAGEVLRLLSGPVSNGPSTRVGTAALRAAALVDLGRAADAGAELRAVDPDVLSVSPAVATLHAVASIRAAVGTDPEVACTLAEFTVAAAGADAPPALLAAHAAALRAAGRDSWEQAARAALEAAAATGDRAAERLAGAALVAGLRDLSRVGEAGDLAAELAEAAAADGAYSSEVTFRADALWAAMHADGGGRQRAGGRGGRLEGRDGPRAGALPARGRPGRLGGVSAHGRGGGRRVRADHAARPGPLGPGGARDRPPARAGGAVAGGRA